MAEKPERRYDIDWLRVILFGLLIPFHVAIGVYWSTYGDDINPNITDDSDERKEIAEEGNDYTYESVDPTSMFLHWMHQWRLAALFMISGMGTAFAFKRRNWKTFLTERLQRLLVPMFFGMWTVGFVGGIITGSADLDGNSFVDTTVAFILHVLLHRSFSGFHCSGKSLPSAICGSFGICSCIHYWAYQFSILCKNILMGN